MERESTDVIADVFVNSPLCSSMNVPFNYRNRKLDHELIMSLETFVNKGEEFDFSVWAKDSI